MSFEKVVNAQSNGDPNKVTLADIERQAELAGVKLTKRDKEKLLEDLNKPVLSDYEKKVLNMSLSELRQEMQNVNRQLYNNNQIMLLEEQIRQREQLRVNIRIGIRTGLWFIPGISIPDEIIDYFFPHPADTIPGN